MWHFLGFLGIHLTALSFQSRPDAFEQSIIAEWFREEFDGT